MISHKQRRQLMELANAAFTVDCGKRGVPADFKGFDAWRHEQLKAACGRASTKEMNPTLHFDKAMLHLAILAEDDRLATRFAVAVERRFRWVVLDLLRKIGELDEATYTWEYVLAIAKHMNLPPSIDDCTHEMLQKVIAALDTQRRRILASRGDLSPRFRSQNPHLGDGRRVKDWKKAHPEAA